MTTKCVNCPIRRKDLFAQMTTEELKVMQRFKVGEMTVEPGAPLMTEGTNSPQLYTALRGLGLRTKLLENGRRQVINMVFPGDFIGLQSAVMDEMGHSVEATSHMTLCVFDRSALYDFFAENPKRAFSLTWLAAAEEHFLGDALATLGQRTATQAMAWALVKLFQKGTALGMVDGNTMSLPYRQQDMADALGLSLVHTNRTLNELRKRQLAAWTEGKLVVNDIEALMDCAIMEKEPLEKRPLM